VLHLVTSIALEAMVGMESANVLLDRSGVVLTEGPFGPPTFRYGDLIKWMEDHRVEFNLWLEEFDPVLKRPPGQADISTV
jgi:hypothetical protein